MDSKDFKRRLLRGADAESLLELFEHLPGVGFWIKDRKGRLAANNQTGVLRKPGCYRESDVIGRTDLDFFPAALAKRFLQDDLAVVERGARLAERQEWLLNRDGRLELHKTVKVPLKDKKGAVIGSAGITIPQGGPLGDFPSDGGLRKAVDRMRSDLADPPSTAQMARLSGLSTRQFERRFRQTVGTSPKQFLLQVRVEAACKALAGSRSSVKEIAAATGFTRVGAFVTRFKALLGMTPGEYRKRYGKEGA